MVTLEKRVEDLEYIITHLPEDLDARFAGVDAKLATIREALAVHSTRFTTIDRKIEVLDKKVDGLDRKVVDLAGKADGLDRKVGDLAGKVELVLAELAKIATSSRS